jgi:DnaA family protein
MTQQQMILNVTSRDSLHFDSFYAGNDENGDVLSLVKAFSQSDDRKQFFLWGETHSGKTHLLQACCYHATEQGRRVSYLPMKTLATYGSTAARGLDSMDLIVIDDVDCVLGNPDWEEALFDLVNHCRISKQRLMFSSTQNPRYLECDLPDLASRLIWGETYTLHALTEEEKHNALLHRAKIRHLNISDRVMDYLSRHYPRDMGSLLTILDVLDQESIRRQSKITIPFLKQVLDS